MTTRVLVAAIIVAASACGGDGGSEMMPPMTGGQPAAIQPAGTCAKRTGLYRTTYTVQSGNCGPQNESVENADSAGPEVDRTSCVVEFDAPPTTAGNLTVTGKGKVTWSADASTGTGTLFLEVRAVDTGAILCTGVYTIAERRL